MEFMKWLGIAFPRWIENELRPAPDPLQRSLLLCRQILASVQAYARENGIPIGINVDTVQYANGTTTTAKLSPNCVQHVEAKDHRDFLSAYATGPAFLFNMDHSLNSKDANGQVGKIMSADQLLLVTKACDYR
jgi:hypothetical protein